MIKDVIGWEDLYAVTEDGRVWSKPKTTVAGNGVKNHSGVWLKSHAYSMRTNHQRVYLSRDGKKYGKQVHRLVAEAFLPNPNRLPVVNHIDGNPLNNHVSNLEWTTNSGNCKHAVAMGLTKLPNQVGSNNSNAKLQDSDVLKIRNLADSGMSIVDIAKMFLVARKTIRDVVRGVSWRHLFLV